MKTEQQIKEKMEKLLVEDEENDWQVDMRGESGGFNTYDTSSVLAGLRWVLTA